MLDVIVINRKSEIDRLAFMTAQLDQLGIRFYRLEAFTPDTLSEADEASAKSTVASPLSAEDRARHLSHRTAWEWVSSSGPALILEDDAVLARQVPDLMANLAVTDMEHLSLEVRGRRKLVSSTSIPIAHGVSAHRMYRDTAGAAAYVLWPAGARRLLAQARRAPARAEITIARARGLRSFQASPALAMQLDMIDRYGLTLQPLDSELNGTKAQSRPFRRIFQQSAETVGMIGSRLRYLMRARPLEVPVKAEYFDL